MVASRLVPLLAVGAGGFVGSVARFATVEIVSRYVRSPFPVWTLAVNVIGCLAIGALSVLFEWRHPPGASFRLFLATGILGGFTTFSAFGYETVALLRDGRGALAFANVAANVLAGLGAVWLGRAAAIAAAG